MVRGVERDGAGGWCGLWVACLCLVWSGEPVGLVEACLVVRCDEVILMG